MEYIQLHIQLPKTLYNNNESLATLN